jgi:ParB family chromosome partitioning protein
MKKQALGKGLKAFLSEEYGILREDRYVELEVDKLRPNPNQPRTKFDPVSIAELAQSIKETGILQPLVVVPNEDHFTIIVGERRWRAAQKIGLRTIPVIIRQMTEEHQMEASLVENLQREDLNPLEIASAYKRMTHDLHLTQEQVADKVGKDRASVSNFLKESKTCWQKTNCLWDTPAPCCQ